MGAKRIRTVIALASILVLAGCGTPRNEPLGWGGTVGAAKGSLVSTAPGNLEGGAIIGAGTGDAASAMVDPCNLDLYNPVWQDHGGLAAYERRCGHPPPP